jgi:flagellin-like hook-associated protein FlgL
LDDLLRGGSVSGLGSNTSAALRVVDEALGKLTLLEGRVDAFADVTVESASKLLEGLESDVQETLNSLNRVNEDEESLKLAKSQTLASTTLSALAIMQQQQFSALGLVRLLAGI